MKPREFLQLCSLTTLQLFLEGAKIQKGFDLNQYLNFKEQLKKKSGEL